ncbi:Rho GTPase-activating protein 2 [Bienertia sinuspersici]
MTLIMVTKGGGGCGGGGGATKSPTTKKSCEEEDHQISLVALLLATLRKSIISCRVDRREQVIHHLDFDLDSHDMDIGWPTNVKHITHVTFDRFHGFLGLPVEFKVQIPTKVPSARSEICVFSCSVSVFGVSAESMQCAYDTKGNSVPIILLLMQERLYSQGGLKAEGIFRINPENGQEQVVRDQLNRGIVPDDIDVHCLAGLIKTWFRELPSGVLDGLSPDQVLQCNNEEDYIVLVKQLKPMEAALLNWAIELMADVVEEEDLNKMNARNIAMVFAPNMTQMSDPLTALMHAVQVMNLLKTLVTKTLREREESVTDDNYSPMSSRSSGQVSDEEYDSHREMDTCCDSREPASDIDESAENSCNREYHEDEGGSLSEIESVS